MSKETNEKSKDTKDMFDGMYQEDSLPEKLAKDYRIFSCLKHTETKKVYILEEKGSGERYILKCRLKEEAELLQQEYDTLTSIKEDFVPKVFSFFVEENTAYLLREYIAGETLEQRVAKVGVYEPNQAIDTMISVCNIVQRMHKHEPILVHRDIKPENILVTEDGKYKFIDMDTVREYKEESSHDTVFMGSWGVAAPEQFGFGQSDPRTDIYSLGVLFLFLSTGTYKMESAEWKEIPKPIQETIQKCMEFDAKNRYPSVDALCLELNSLKRFSKRRKTLFLQTGIAFVGIPAIVLLIIFCVGSYQKRISEVSTGRVLSAGIANITDETTEMTDNIIYDEDGACHIAILTKDFIPPLQEVDYVAVDPEMADIGSFRVTPYWTENLEHPGLLQPGNEDNYSLWFDYQQNIMYMRNLNLDIYIYGDIPSPAILTDTDLTIVLEGDNTVTCHGGVPLRTRECTITFEGSGDLTLRAVDSERMTAAMVEGDVIHNGTGTITLEPCGGEYGMQWISPSRVLGDGKWINLPTLPYDRDNEFAIIIKSLEWDMEYVGVQIDGYAWDYSFEGNPYWKNDPNHPGKLMPGTESDYNLKYVDGTLYLKELNLEVRGPWMTQNAVQIGENVPTTIVLEEGDSSITGVNIMAFHSESPVTFEGPGNLTLKTEGDFDEDCPALTVSTGDITHNGTGTITLISSQNSKYGGVCAGELKGDGKWVNFTID